MSHFDNELQATKSAVADLHDQELLANIGYKQEMKRSFGLVSMIGFTFSILTCWNALAGSLGESFLNGGPAALVYGWIGCCAFSLCVATVMAELASAYPVAGGQYSWCLILAKDTKWGRVVSYACGWIQTTGILGMVAVGWYQFSIDLNAMISLLYPSYIAHNWRVALIAYASGLFSLLIDTFGMRILHYIAMLSLYWSIGGFVICTVVILAVAKRFQPASFVFTSTINEGWSNRGMSVILGIMQTAYGMCTYDSVAHLSEETADAAKQTPRAMVMAIVIGFFTGFGFILALLFCIQDVEAVVNTATGLPLLEIFYQATNSHAGAICLCIISLVTQVFTNISLLTEGSRAVYAFARDGAFPSQINKVLDVVHPTLDVPLNALLFSFVVAAILVAILFGSSTAFFTVMSIASTGLYISYLMCVFVYTIKPKNKAPGYYNLGGWAIWLQIPAIVYLTFCCIFFFFPTTVPVTGSNMNYCVAAFAIMAIFSVSSWFFGARHTFVRDVGVIEGQAVLAEAQAHKKADESSSVDNTDGSVEKHPEAAISVH